MVALHLRKRRQLRATNQADDIAEEKKKCRFVVTMTEGTETNMSSRWPQGRQLDKSYGIAMDLTRYSLEI